MASGASTAASASRWPATCPRALYMAALEVTKSSVRSAVVRFGVSEPAASAVASAAGGGLRCRHRAGRVDPVDVISQRLMVQISTACRRRGRLQEDPRLSIITYVPSNAVWWASYAMAQRFTWHVVGADRSESYPTLMAVQGTSAAVTMPLDTVKTRLQVMETDAAVAWPTLGSTMRGLLKEGGWAACYRGQGPRWGSMSLSATTMVTTYELLKRLSA